MARYHQLMLVAQAAADGNPSQMAGNPARCGPNPCDHNSSTRRPTVYPGDTSSVGSCLHERSSKYSVASVSQPMKKPAPPQIVPPPSPPRVVPISDTNSK